MNTRQLLIFCFFSFVMYFTANATDYSCTDTTDYIPLPISKDSKNTIHASPVDTNKFTYLRDQWLRGFIADIEANVNQVLRFYKIKKGTMCYSYFTTNSVVPDLFSIEIITRSAASNETTAIKNAFFHKMKENGMVLLTVDFKKKRRSPAFKTWTCQKVADQNGEKFHIKEVNSSGEVTLDFWSNGASPTPATPPGAEGAEYQEKIKGENEGAEE